MTDWLESGAEEIRAEMRADRDVTIRCRREIHSTGNRCCREDCEDCRGRQEEAYAD